MIRPASRTITFTLALSLFANLASAGPWPIPFRTPLPALPVQEEPLPPGAWARLGSTRFLNSGGVDKLVVAPNERTLALPCTNGVNVFQVRTGKLLQRIRTVTYVSALGYARDGSLLIAGAHGDDRNVFCRHDPETGRLLQMIRWPEGMQGAALFHPDGSLMAAGNGDKILMRDLQIGRARSSVSVPDHGINLFEFSPDGRWLGASTHPDPMGQSSLFVLFDRYTCGEVLRLPLAPPIRGFCFSRDGHSLALMHAEDRLLILDIPSGKVRMRTQTQDSLRHLFFTADGNVLVFRDTGSSAVLLDGRTGTKLRELEFGLDLYTIVLTPDLRTIIGCSMSGGICLWDLATGKRLAQSAEFPSGLDQIEFIAPDRLLGHTRNPGWLTWNLANRTYRPLPDPIRERQGPHRVAAGIFAVADAEGIHLFDLKQNRPLPTLSCGEEFEPLGVWLSKDARQATALSDDSFHVVTIATGSRRVLKLQPSDHFGVDVTENGHWLGVIDVNGDEGITQGTVRVYDLQRMVQAYEFPTRLAVDVNFTPDGRHLLVSRLRIERDDVTGLEIEVRDAHDGRLLRQLEGNYSQQFSIPMSPDSRCGLLYGPTQSLQVVELATGQIRCEFHPADGSYTAGASFSPDGVSLATTGNDGLIYLWDLRRRRQPRLPPPDRPTCERLWQDLAALDSRTAFSAICRLEQHPEIAAALLRNKITAARPLASATVLQWIDDLEHPLYAVRARAERDLLAEIDRARPLIEASLQKPAAPETRQRLLSVLQHAERMTPERLQLLRSIEVLEYAGQASVLKDWSQGAPGAFLTDEAQRALARLQARRSVP